MRDLTDLNEGGETVLTLRELAPRDRRRKYFAQNVVATVSRSLDPAGEAQPLRVRSMVGNVLPGEWYVLVSELLPSHVPGTPYSNAFEALRQAGGLRRPGVEPA